MSLVGLFLITAMGVSAQVTPATPPSAFVCNGQSVQLTGPDGYTNYQWYFDANGSANPAVAIGDSGQQVYTATESGFYYVEVWKSGDDCKSPNRYPYTNYIHPPLYVRHAAKDCNKPYFTYEF